MFSVFLDHFSPTNTDADSSPNRTKSLFPAIYQQIEGTTFEHGLYRIHTVSSGRAADRLIANAFPTFTGRIRSFGFDWMGRQFAADFGRMVDEQPQVLLFEPGTGEVLEISARFDQFHDEELVEAAQAALAVSFFRDWQETYKRPLQFDQCVGYRVPLFLSGVDTLDNLEVVDLDVYWSLTAQLIQQTRHAVPGARAHAIRLPIDDL